MGNRCTWYWNNGKWVLGACLYLNELRKLGYLARQGFAGDPPPPPKPEELAKYPRYTKNE